MEKTKKSYEKKMSTSLSPRTKSDRSDRVEKKVTYSRKKKIKKPETTAEVVPEPVEKKPKVKKTWEKNAVHTLEIQGYTAEGAGVARLDGRVVFIPHTIKGEIWEVTLVKVNKNFAFGRGLTCVEPSPQRVEEDCKFSAKCGGCQLRHMSYEEELRLKQDTVKNSLERIGGLENVDILPILGSKEQNHYRNKVQYQISGSDKWVKIGFYRARSHDVLDVETCLLQKEFSTIARNVLKTWMVDKGVNPYDEATGKGTIRHFFIRCNEKEELDLCLVATRRSLPHLDELIEAMKSALPKLLEFTLIVNKEDSNVVLQGEAFPLISQEILEIGLFDQKFQVRNKSFFQVNQPQTEVLYTVVRDFAQLTGTERVLDLYCGTGSIGISLSKNAGYLAGVEISESSTADASANAQRNSVANAQFFCQDCGEIPTELQGFGDRTFDVVVVDPPRKGLSAPEKILEFIGDKLVYVSCDPATLARDLKFFTNNGLSVEKIQPVDMFPRTRHVECVVLLQRKK